MKAKITTDDALAAMKIALTSFRGSRILFRSLRRVRYDEALQRAINKIDKWYITYIIYIVGLFVSSVAAYERIGPEAVPAAVLLWTLAAGFIINPLVYLMVLPRPIRDHIKRVDDLTEAERQLFEAEERRGKDERTANILDKYKNSG